ncbi:DUF1671-domain-containing protein [Sporormia fimetaria CBS 119925]|uniref:DUF1671-domain-containing protein n=1 Tax=Sporormia fimetaria CBS 119925 TaxID=1340428 RepID=A0A6A6VML4_9PLEO|nr:DUF1671-domain-containing protein [Sporormia fimetaria CBS 119925]
MALLECPLCGFSVRQSEEYFLQLHFEQEHTEDSPFRIEDDPEPLPVPLATQQPSQLPGHVDTATPSASEEECNVFCPEPDCGELVLLTDFNDHLDLHAASTLSFDETTGKYHSQQPINMQRSYHQASNSKGTSKAPSFLEPDPHASSSSGGPRRPEDDSRKLKKRVGRGNSTGSEKSTLSRSIAAFNPFSRHKAVKAPQNTARLGRAELGPHAWEDRMPKWLHDQLAEGPKITIVNRIGRDGRLIKQEQVQNETPGIIPVLAQLSTLDRSVKQAYYCHPATLHIGKTPKEGGFCGYRNMQMLISYIQGAHAQGHEEFPGRTPGILKLQDLIERAWDKGINEIGRQQTGGIRDTRKYVGTPEAQALFLSSQIDCAVELFTDSPDGQIEAHEQLLYAVESYFSQAAVSEDGTNVLKTLLPPIYLQQPGHSVTIVGFERRKDGASNLVVFDPMYHTSPAMHALIGRKNIRTHRPEVLQAYRRGSRQLGKHAAFEALMLTAFPPLFPAWDVLRQFPDCRFVYAFFRSKTLGYDVYPEDHFLRNFPWQQYGGLWIVDDARFARAEKMNPLAAQALRRITGEGASPPSETVTSSGNLGHFPSLVPSLDGSMSSHAVHDSLQPVLSMIGMRPALSVQVPPTGKKNPGYPNTASPSSTAKHLYPSPASEAGSQGVTARPVSPHDTRAQTQPEYSTNDHGSRRDSGIGMDSARSSNSPPSQRVEYVAEARHGGMSIASNSRSGSPSPNSSASPPRPHSPRTAMLKSMVGKQALQNISHNPSLFPREGQPPASPAARQYFPQGSHIANGIETSTVSPISPTGTMLRYTSHRPVEQGLLALKPLSEAQVAEYRFWRPCGRRVCAFGCGAGSEGEMYAARKLFRDVEPVEEEYCCDGESE